MQNMQKRKHTRHAKKDQIKAKIKKIKKSKLQKKKYFKGNMKKNAEVPNLPNQEMQCNRDLNREWLAKNLQSSH